MRNYIIYTAASPEEINGCSYALLKYLAAYNLKPPASHAVVVYTNRPAALEVFGSYINDFDLRPVPAVAAPDALVRDFGPESSGGLLFLSPWAYPSKPLEPLWNGIRSGIVYRDEFAATVPRPAEMLLVLGAKAPLPASVSSGTGAEVRSARDFISHYRDFPEFNQLLREFFERYQEESIPNLIKLIAPIDPNRLKAQKAAFDRLPFYVRWARQLMGKGWMARKRG